ncbi:GNAT family N-acetyltransferase [Secundilactobacillus kimchicus]|uniref:GNAT family N-acetyltransferase n=1 Tax=Secundilactobacillus kimchicus TaxID=528209 RepID=UPI001C0291B8|nr:GNAT family N-acetyltransferase [Secundilactobacillus kimchicus]MBT9672302.1 GNAT family N-acetyltransferase [Secundilactobacillus kimchicus]
MKIEQVKPADLKRIVAIEKTGFSPEEAGSEAAFQQRIRQLATTFLVARDSAGVVQGFIVGPAVAEPFVLDWMYEMTPQNLETGGHQLVLSLAVSPAAQGQHIGSDLLAALTVVAQRANRQTLSLTCLDRLVAFYEKNGFENCGVAESDHADEVWYNMVKTIA